MYPPGHIAINILLVTTANRTIQKNDWKDLGLPIWPAILAALAPDVVDKVVCDYLHLAPYGRNWMHNLVAVVMCSLALGWAMRSRYVGLSWAVGHLGHLLGDFVFVPWLWPLFDYIWPVEDRLIAQGVVQTLWDLGHGRELSSEAAAIWNGGRLLFEVFFLMSAGLLYWRHQYKAFYTVLSFLSVALWGCIALAWDWRPFLWSWTHYGIR